MTGTASIRATPTGVELRQGHNRIVLYAHQITAFANYAIDQLERIEHARNHETQNG